MKTPQQEAEVLLAQHPNPRTVEQFALAQIARLNRASCRRGTNTPTELARLHHWHEVLRIAETASRQYGWTQ